MRREDWPFKKGDVVWFSVTGVAILDERDGDRHMCVAYRYGPEDDWHRAISAYFDVTKASPRPHGDPDAVWRDYTMWRLIHG